MSTGPKRVELKVRVTAKQAAWLRARADERFGGRMSDAIRSALSDARLLELARADYDRLADDQGFRLPVNREGDTTVLEVILARPLGFEFQEIAE